MNDMPDFDDMASYLNRELNSKNIFYKKEEIALIVKTLKQAYEAGRASKGLPHKIIWPTSEEMFNEQQRQFMSLDDCTRMAKNYFGSGFSAGYDWLRAKIEELNKASNDDKISGGSGE